MRNIDPVTKRKLCGLLGMAAKAGKIVSGELPAEKSLKSGKAKLCLLADDASEATVKHFTDMCSYRNIPAVSIALDKDTLGHVIGRGSRSSVIAEDSGFAEGLMKLLKGEIVDEQ